MTLPFEKMNGAGNDFVMLDNRDESLTLTGEQVARLCDRHRGVGADGVLVVEPARNGADFRMRYYNADGGEAEMCGNGARCFARYVRKLTGDHAAELTFETIAGVIGARFEEARVRVALSDPVDLLLGRMLALPGGMIEVHSINTGVPHAVLVVEDLAGVDVPATGAAIRYHDAFAPKGTNVNFLKVLAPGSIAIRTYERGVEGETLACGTGMAASALVHHALTGAPSPVSVEVAGGDTLRVGFARDGEDFTAVTLTGPAEFVFEGKVAI